MDNLIISLKYKYFMKRVSTYLKMNLNYYEIVDLIQSLGGKATQTQIREYLKQKYGIMPAEGIRAYINNRFLKCYLAVVLHEGLDKYPRLDFLYEVKQDRYERVTKELGVERLVEGLPMLKKKVIVSAPKYAEKKNERPIIFQKDNHVVKAIVYFKILLNSKNGINGPPWGPHGYAILNALDSVYGFNQPFEVIE